MSDVEIEVWLEYLAAVVDSGDWRAIAREIQPLGFHHYDARYLVRDYPRYRRLCSGQHPDTGSLRPNGVPRGVWWKSIGDAYDLGP